MAIIFQYNFDLKTLLIKLQELTMSSLLKLGLVGALSIGGTWLLSTQFLGKLSQNPNPNTIESQDKPIQQIIKEVYLRINTKQNMGILKKMYSLDCLDSNQIVEPYEYTLKTGGKKIRLIMAAIVAEMFIGNGTVPKEVIQVGGLIQFLHSASLIIDDIEDGSLQRRGQPCSHLVYGLDRSINAANLMYFLPFNKLLNCTEKKQKKVELLKIFIEEMTVSHMGQAQDILVHKVKQSEQLPSLEQYELLTIAKTSSLLRMMVKMLCVLLDRTQRQLEQLSEVMNYIGLAFQVTDDVLNLSKNIGKGEIAEDLREKKFTPIIHCLRNHERFIQLFVRDDKDDQTIKQMLEIIGKSDALVETKKLAQKYEEKAEQLIKGIKTPHSRKNFQKLMKFIITRQN